MEENVQKEELQVLFYTCFPAAWVPEGPVADEGEEAWLAYVVYSSVTNHPKTLQAAQYRHCCISEPVVFCGGSAGTAGTDSGSVVSVCLVVVSGSMGESRWCRFSVSGCLGFPFPALIPGAMVSWRGLLNLVSRGCPLLRWSTRVAGGPVPGRTSQKLPNFGGHGTVQFVRTDISILWGRLGDYRFGRARDPPPMCQNPTVRPRQRPVPLRCLQRPLHRLRHLAFWRRRKC